MINNELLIRHFAFTRLLCLPLTGLGILEMKHMLYRFSGTGRSASLAGTATDPHRFRRLSVPEFFCFCRSASSHWSKTFDPSWTDRWLGTYRLPDCRPKSRRLWTGHSVEGESSGPCLQPFSTETPWNPRHGPVFPGILWKQPLLAGWLCFVYGM